MAEVLLILVIIFAVGPGAHCRIAHHDQRVGIRAYITSRRRTKEDTPMGCPTALSPQPRAAAEILLKRLRRRSPFLLFTWGFVALKPNLLVVTTRSSRTTLHRPEYIPLVDF
jgi:hypothetical protein